MDTNSWLNGANAEPKKLAINPETQRKYLHPKETDTKSNEPSVTTIKILPVEKSAPIEPEPVSKPVSTFVSSLNKTAITITSDLANKPPVEKEQPTRTDEIVFRSNLKPHSVPIQSEPKNGHINGSNGNAKPAPAPVIADRKTKTKSG